MLNNNKHSLIDKWIQILICKQMIISIKYKHKKNNQLVVVEVKCGFTGVRHAPATKEGRRCKMRAPLSQVDDTALHRHLAQLAATRQMLLGDVDVVKKLQELALDGELGAVLLYLDDESAELFDLPDWWLRRGAKLLKALGG